MNPGTIVILNGASSSGKTSIIKALQEILDEPYLEAGLDKFLWMLPKRFLDKPLWDEVLGLATRSGAVGDRLVSGMHHAIAALAQAGNNVVAEHVFVEQKWVTECATLFSKLPAYLIGVHCPLEVLELREKERSDRTLGQARAQFPIVHAYVEYDLEIDTSLARAKSCALEIQRRLQDGIEATAFRRIRQRSLS
jgi:chloramphenicol 3-O phosphotransferase